MNDDQVSGTEAERVPSETSKSNEGPTQQSPSELRRFNGLHVALLIFSLAALVFAGAYSLDRRYTVHAGERRDVLLDHWKGELLQVGDGSAHTIRIHKRENKALIGGRLWGEFDDIPIEAELFYANGSVFYRFTVNSYDDDIERAIRNSMTITFELGTDRGVTLHTIRESFSNVTHVVDSSAGNLDTIGVVFDGVFSLDAGAWDGLSRLSTRFQR